jgi:endonuclease YncB( thermonuclease family)
MFRRATSAAAFALAAALVCAGCEGSDVTRVVDGEHLIVKGHKITLYGVDAPDAGKAKCDAEKVTGDATLARLKAMISGAKEVSFRKTGMACLQFMDCDGFVMADGVDVGEALIAEGLADRKVVEGGGNEPRDWCALKPLPPIESITPAPVAKTPNPT